MEVPLACNTKYYHEYPDEKKKRRGSRHIRDGIWYIWSQRQPRAREKVDAQIVNTKLLLSVEQERLLGA